MAKAYWGGEDKYTKEEYTKYNVEFHHNFADKDEYYIHIDGKKIAVNQGNAEDYVDKCKDYKRLAANSNTTYTKKYDAQTNSILFDLAEDFYTNWEKYRPGEVEPFVKTYFLIYGPNFER